MVKGAVETALVALLALLSWSAVAEAAIVSGRGRGLASDCLGEGAIWTTAQVDEPPFSLLCNEASRSIYLGSQAYYQDGLHGQDGEAQSERKSLHLWQAHSAADIRPQESTSLPQYAFIAWERLEGQASAQVDGLSWSDRLHAALTRSTKSAAADNRVAEKGEAKRHLLQKVLSAFTSSGEQAVDNDEHIVHVDVLETHPTYAIARVPSLKALLDLSIRLPRDTRMTRLIAQSTSAKDDKPSRLPVPHFKPPLHSLLFSETLDVPNLRKDARVLTGEDESGQRTLYGEKDDSLINTAKQYWHSRHSATPEAKLAAAWIRARLAHDLAPINATCDEWSYDEGFSPNVVCTIPATPHIQHAHDEDEGIVVFSAHYDSRGTFGSTRAPGGDDDGSGTTMLLALARHLGTHKIKFQREVRLIAFSGEEQGLVGSQHYAAHLRNASVPVHFQLQTDMIGYRKPGEELQIAFPDRLATANATAYVMAIAKLYVPEVHLGYTPACCSDHQSFWEQGFTSTWIFERRGPIADPCYHDSCDVTDRPGYDFDQVRAATRVVLATLLDVAGGVFWPYAG